MPSTDRVQIVIDGDSRKPPEAVAEGALNRLCAYDAVKAPADYEKTLERIVAFQGAFTRLAAERLAAIARKS